MSERGRGHPARSAGAAGAAAAPRAHSARLSGTAGAHGGPRRPDQDTASDGAATSRSTGSASSLHRPRPDGGQRTGPAGRLRGAGRRRLRRDRARRRLRRPHAAGGAPDRRGLRACGSPATTSGRGPLVQNTWYDPAERAEDLRRGPRARPRACRHRPLLHRAADRRRLQGDGRRPSTSGAPTPAATASSTSSSTTTTSSSRSSTAGRSTTSCSRRPTPATSSSSSTSAGSRSAARAPTSTSGATRTASSLFHVKDIRLGPERLPRGRSPAPRTPASRFFFADVGKGVIDWPKIFSALRNPKDHHYFVEHDDAGDDETLDATSPRPRNPAGSANTAWTGRKYLANLELPRRRW